MSDSLKQKTVKGVMWTSIDRFANLGFGFVVGIILARILSPSDYGLLAMIAVFNSIAFVFLDSGFNAALIRKPGLTEDDRTTAFYFNIIAGVVLFGIIWMIAPLVSAFYDKPILKPLLRAEGLLLIIVSFRIVQNNQLRRSLNFKSLMIVRTSGNLMGGVAGIIAAFSNMGVWSLVLMHITEAVVSLIMSWVISPWRPHGHWSRISFNYLWGFGSKLMISGLMDSIFGNISPIIIGKFYSAADLGQYMRAHQYAAMPSGFLCGVLNQVSFPVLSRIQEDVERLADNYRRILRFSVFVVFPVMMGMAALARPFVVVLVTDKWDQCVPYLQIICFSAMWYPVHSINLSLLQVIGRSDLFLRLEVIKKILSIIVIFVCVPFGIIVLCYGSLFNAVVGLFINTYYTGKLIHVGLIKQMKDMLPSLLASLVMMASIYLITIPIGNDILKLAVGIPSGVVLYLFIAWLFKMPELQETIDMVRNR